VLIWSGRLRKDGLIGYFLGPVGRQIVTQIVT
jgi:hypothetical protein